MKSLFALVAISAMALLSPQAHAQSDAEAQQACGSDVFALCSDDMPDRARIGACLRRHASQVSSACRVFMASGSGGQAHKSYASVRHHTRHHRHYHYRTR